jgi:hypothetical protein
LLVRRDLQTQNRLEVRRRHLTQSDF